MEEPSSRSPQKCLSSNCTVLCECPTVLCECPTVQCECPTVLCECPPTHPLQSIPHHHSSGSQILGTTLQNPEFLENLQWQSLCSALTSIIFWGVITKGFYPLARRTNDSRVQHGCKDFKSAQFVCMLGQWLTHVWFWQRTVVFFHVIAWKRWLDSRYPQFFSFSLVKDLNLSRRLYQNTLI